jgi:uroporphyrinogen decarboxylase
MASRREIIKAIIKDKVCPERMGLFESFWPDTQEEWEKQGLPRGVDLYNYFDHDIRHIDGSVFFTDAIPGKPVVLEDNEHSVVVRNGWGAVLREWKHKPGTPEHLAFDMISEEVWRRKYRENLLCLDLNRFEDLDQLKQNFSKCMDSDKFSTYIQLTVFEIMRRSMGDIVMLEAMCLNPAWIHDFCDVVTNNIIFHLEYMLSEIGIPDGIWIYEDMGYTQAPFVSPQLYRELIFPYHKRLVGFVHDYGIPMIMHSCGRVEPLLPHIAETGVDCLQVLEAKAGQHVARMAESVANKMAFMGNMDIRAFESNDRRQLEKEIVPKLKAVAENKIPYVFHSDHSIPRTVRLETYEYALELFREHGRY